MAFEAPEMVALATDPIRPDMPAGDPVTYDPDFEAIKAEIGKLDKGEQPEWPDIVARGTEILKTRGKDLTVACYVAVGLFHQKGYPGLAGGLLMLDALLATYWDTLYPEKNRVRGRVAALSWMHDRGAHAVGRKSPNRSDNEPAQAALDALNRISALSDDKLGQESPGMRELIRALETAVRDSAAPAPSAAPAASTSSGGAGGSMPGLTLDSWDGALRSIGTVGTEIEKIVAYMISYNPGSPIPYLLNRGLAWCRIIEPPPAGDDGMTPFPAPDPGMIAGWEALAAGNQWKQLVEEAEKRLSSAPFLLDINYHVARGLDGLGNPAARQAVVEQTLALVRRLPKLLDLKYQDGRPFASDATRAWLEAAGAGAGGGGGGASPSEEPDDPLGPATQEARTLAARGKLGDAVTLMTDGMLQCVSPRDSFRWRLALAGVCLDAGQAVAAVAHLEALDDEVDRHGLESWEPALVSEWLKVFYRCEKKLSQNGHREQKETVQRLDRLYGRLCRIDTLSALSLDKR